ncbi:MAG TPA: multiheme c-type cytochrome [Thermoanaerobaculia bacterium]|nr:multiheme c-type cytochrome [Thermoanaerobaculia bacterium]
MPRRSLTIALVLAATAAASLQSQQTVPPASPDALPLAPGRYAGVASCVNSGCHGSTTPLQTNRVLQNEYYTWLNEDRHAKAYNVLFNAKSIGIVRNMRLKGKAFEESICLDCHATNVPKRSVAGHVDVEDGIQCETCHGPAGGWRDEHTQAGWTHEQSVARGMIDLRRISARGVVCLSCHMGNREKTVDHELIAAGHPQLAFELDNYTETMPPHWNPGKQSHGVAAWAGGQVIALRESLENLSHHARGRKWPEFSALSCDTCHHSLKGSEWRQARGWSDRAGLPAWSPEHWAVVRLLIARSSPATRDQLDPLIDELSRRVSRMNDPTRVAETADGARQIVESAIAGVERLDWKEPEVRALMSAIAGDEAFLRRADVHTAEQVALSLDVLSSALTRRKPSLIRGPLKKAIDALFAEVADRPSFDPARFVEKLEAVKAAM